MKKKQANSVEAPGFIATMKSGNTTKIYPVRVVNYENNSCVVQGENGNNMVFDFAMVLSYQFTGLYDKTSFDSLSLDEKNFYEYLFGVDSPYLLKQCWQGKPIYENQTVVLPDGEEGVVIFSTSKLEWIIKKEDQKEIFLGEQATLALKSFTFENLATK